MDGDKTTLERDSLTGAFTRSALEHLYRLLEGRGVVRTPSNLSLTLLDLDHLKLVNDVFGHLRGDAVLAHLGAEVLKLLEPQQFFVRYGGDEFVLLSSHDAEDAQRWAQTLLERLSLSRVSGVPPLRVSVSVGCATRQDASETLTTLLERADLRLYAAKRAGRGRIGGDPEQPPLQDPGRLLEREAALDAVRDALERLERREGGLYIYAEDGVGLSRTLREAASLAQTLGYAPFTLEGLESSRHRSEAALEAALTHSNLPLDFGSPAQLVSLLLERADTFGTPLLLVDRPDRLDPDSLRVAHQLEAALGGAIWGTLPHSGSGSSGAVNQDSPGGYTLTPLGLESFGHWLLFRLGWAVPASFVQVLHTHTEGRPGWAARLIPALEREARGRRVSVWELPERFIESLKFNPAPLEPRPLLVGRGREIRALTVRLKGETLAVVCGPGGVGKSALVRQWVREYGHRFEGVFWLEGETLARTVLGRVLTAASRVALEGETEAAAVARLLGRPYLFILESVLDPVAVKEVLLPLMGDRGSRAVLTTGQGESGDLILRGLPIPVYPNPASSENPLEALIREPAVQVFLARATVVRPDYRLSATDAPLLVELCERLEGLPHALELAAGWLELNPLNSVLETLRQGALRLLEAGSQREGLRGVRAVLEYLWEPLSSEERRAVAGLSELPPPFSAQAAREVVGVSPLMLSGLKNKGIVLERGSGFALPALLQDFLLEQLERLGLRAFVVSRWHSALTRQVAALCQHSDALHRARDFAALDALRPALVQTCERLASSLLEANPLESNLLEVQPPKSKSRTAERLLYLCTLLGPYWLSRALLYDPVQWLELALLHAPESVRRAAAWVTLGELRQHLGDHLQAWTAFEQARQASLLEENPFILTDAELGLGRVAHRMSLYPEALEWYAQALGHAQGCGDPLLKGAALTGMGRSRIYLGQLERARQEVEQGLDLLLPLGQESLTLIALNTLGLIAMEERRLEEARELLGQALERHLRAGNALGAALNQTGLGWCELLLDHPQASLEHSQACLGFYGSIDGAWEVANALVNCGHARVRLAQLSSREGLPGEASAQLTRAREHYLEGLELALRIQATSVQTEAMAGLAAIALERGDRAMASRLFSAAAHSEAANAEFWNFFAPLGQRLAWQEIPVLPLERVAQDELRDFKGLAEV